VAVAALSAGDAMHESGRMLLRLWFDWVRESGLLALWRRQTDLVKQQQGVVARRVRAGDAAKMELNLAEAAVAQTQSAVLQAQTRESAARQAVARMYPAISVPADALLLEPQPVGAALDYWQERILAHNHELAAARAEVKRRETVASRARADRLPDPSVGLRYSYELDGQERVTGVYLLMPIPGRARAAAAQGADIQIDAARQHEADVLRRVETEVRQSYATATGTFDAWSQLRQAAEGLRKHVELTLRSYQLGESGLADVIAARRLAVDSELAAIQAQVEAAHARYRLMLDAHTLWPLDPGEGLDGHGAH
jgi:outer membrane protein TolC